MEKCTMCGKSFGFMESINRELPDSNRGICLKCHEYFLENIKNKLKDVHTLKEAQAIEEEVLSDVQLKYGEEGRRYVKDFFEYYKKEYIETEPIQLCPVCGSKKPYGETTCAECGYMFSVHPIRNAREMARILNQRYDQYLKNPLYEYKVVTVMDSAVSGKFNENRVQNVLTNHAIDGWRLKTAFTNELGKNALAALGLGINATVDQTILIFERCIKAADEEFLPEI